MGEFDLEELFSKLSPEQRMAALQKLQKEAPSEKSEFELLKERVTALFDLDKKSKSPLKAGDIVRWKKGLSNRKLPAEGQDAIVIEVLTEKNLQKEKDSGTPYYREPLDLALAILDSKGDLVIFHYDQRRFEKVKDGLTFPEKSNDSE